MLSGAMVDATDRKGAEENEENLQYVSFINQYLI
jgi:hypothetical protein